MRLSASARSIGAEYTRYADDLAISGGVVIERDPRRVLHVVSTIAIDEGFAVNFKKVRVMTRSERQRLAGVVVNEKLNVTRVQYDELRAILHNCARSGAESQNLERRPDFAAHLRGRIACVESLNPTRGARLRAALEQIRWS